MLAYYRFHDDVYSVVTDMDGGRELVKCTRSLAAGVFELECRAYGSHDTKVPFLELTVSFVRSNVLVHPTQDKLLTSLCPSSGHNQVIHSSWPGSLATRYGLLSSSSSSKSQSLSLLLDRYQAANAHPHTLDCISRGIKSFGKRSSVVSKESGNSLFAVVLRYHPVFRRAVARARQHLPFPQSLNMELRVGWLNALPSVQSLIMNHSRVTSAAVHNTKVGSGKAGHECVLSFPCNTLLNSWNLGAIYSSNQSVSSVVNIHNLNDVQHAREQRQLVSAS